MPRLLRHDRAHDYKHLVRRWRSVSAKAGLECRKYAEAGGHALYCVISKRWKAGVPSIYLSAGIHGDEAGATEGLIEWAERHPETLRAGNFLLFPCLNAWGLVNNSRRDAEGRDLNRSYNDPAVTQITAQTKLFTGLTFDLALNLHEDYDALGVYVYEVRRHAPFWGEDLLKAAAKAIPPDPRKKIEGRAARNGILLRTIKPDMMPQWPEAFVLFFQNARRVFTIETPSEFHLDDRVAAHYAMIAKGVELCRREHARAQRLTRK